MKPSTIAIVGMAGRFPGARNIREFWQNLRNGVESIRSPSNEELLAAGVSWEDLALPEYVKRASVLDDVPMFDASFFGLSPRDAAIMDPQHRHFLECAWEALEDAGHPPERFSGSIGVFAGSGMNTYLIHNLLANRELLSSAGLFQLKQTGNDKDVLATRVSYQFDLHGPSINVQTACSTSLVAVHLACQSLLNHECDLALAGGVTIEIPHGQGYIYRDGEILARDGHCRSFDAASTGTVFGSGAGIVVLRRLDDALEDRDAIRAVILGSAINNDGARKVGYLAPSVEGQAEVIAEALDFAGVTADEISYVEAHGTGTTVGDPIEVRALTQAFRRTTARRGYCAIGSLKTNIGHLDAAAGVAGLIKTVLALEHAQLPPSLHFQKPNPHIEFQDSPFYVNSQLADWPSNGSLRRAGVTSLGIGGTNAHAVLEEATHQNASSISKPYRLLTFSAKTESAARRYSEDLIAYLEAHREVSLADASFTCQVGRQAFRFRRALVVGDEHNVVSGITDGEIRNFVFGIAAKSEPEFVFMFSGQGSQYVNMGLELYKHEPAFRETLDLCAQHLLDILGLDLRDVIYPADVGKGDAAEKLNQTWLTQPALFAIEYALARWWMSLGIRPSAMVGHSIGEYVAACLAGVFSLEDALSIAAFRGRLMYGLPAGAMLAVSLPATSVDFTGDLSLAAINSPQQCVISGPISKVIAFEAELTEQSIACRRLITSHAFHSAMMDPILGAFEVRMQQTSYQTPSIPFLSNLTGTWIKPEEATSPSYWTSHLRQTVLFSNCLEELSRKPDRFLIEVGPGNTLTSLARQQGRVDSRVFPTLPHPREAAGDLRCALTTLGKIWTLGAEVDWPKLHESETVRRVSLPTYPFEHKKFWIEPDTSKAPLESRTTIAPLVQASNNIKFYRRVWRAELVTRQPIARVGCWIVFNDSLGLGNRIVTDLKADRQDVIVVEAGSSYRQVSETAYTVRPGVRDDYDALIADIFRNGHSPSKIIHLWSVLPENTPHSLKKIEDRSFFSPLFLTQTLGSHNIAGIDVALVSNRMQQVFDEQVRNPARAVLLGPARVIPLELPGITCRSIDVDLENEPEARCAGLILAEMNSLWNNNTIAFRQEKRFVEAVEPINLALATEHRRLEPGGVYLITGGLGGIGLIVAEQLAREFKARLALVSRSAIPAEAQWKASLSHASLSKADERRIQKLSEIRSVAGGLLVLRGDVTSLDQMSDVVASAMSHYGRIDGVFHAAGVLDDGPLMIKGKQGATRVLDPKIRGTLVLEAALRNIPLRCFVLFSSISSIFPPPGQVDYTAANAFLDAFAVSRKGPVTVVNWGAWRNVGMAARSGSQHPLLQERLVETSHEIVYVSKFSQQQWVLSEHKLKVNQQFNALLPGTGYMEMASAAFSPKSRQGAIEFRDVFFLIPLMIEADEMREVRIQLQRDTEAEQQIDAFRFAVFSRTSEWVEHSTGIIEPCLSQSPTTINREAIAARCNQREIVFDEQHRTRQERQFAFGPRWRSLKRLLIGAHEALAEIEMDAKFHADVSTFRIHPALLDLATGASFYLTDMYEESDDLFLPISYKTMRVYRSLPSRLFSHIRSREESPHRGEIETFDITLFDEQGTVLIEIEGFSARRIEDLATVLNGSGLTNDVARAGGTQPIVIEDRRGIEPVAGVHALMRILSSNAPRSLIAVSQPLTELGKPDPGPSPLAIANPRDAESPGESVERTLAAWWQDMLGVDHVALDDDFFSLGGHSLVGVRLLAKIKRAYHVDLDLAALFEARTIRELAEVIHKSK
ncbi:MAG: SDR family NAD(P)-dependent oxidoreductase [Terracidiphilus sp.]